MIRTQTSKCNFCGTPTLQEHVCVLCYGKHVMRGRYTLEDVKNMGER